LTRTDHRLRSAENREIDPVDGAASWTAVLQYGYQAVEEPDARYDYGAGDASFDVIEA
jgi:hypothetical protein